MTETKYEPTDDDIKRFVLNNYDKEKINNITIRCIIRHINIMQQVRGFRNKKQVFEAIEDCAFQYTSLT